jgi:hypothetical protein
MDEKNTVKSEVTEATAPSARAHHAGDGGALAGPVRRFSAQRKLSTVQRLFRGERLEAVSRDLGVPVHRMTEWRDRVFAGAEGALKDRARDAREEEIVRLQAKVGEITMANEVLYAKTDKLEGGRPLARRRSRA